MSCSATVWTRKWEIDDCRVNTAPIDGFKRCHTMIEAVFLASRWKTRLFGNIYWSVYVAPSCFIYACLFLSACLSVCQTMCLSTWIFIAYLYVGLLPLPFCLLFFPYFFLYLFFLSFVLSSLKLIYLFPAAHFPNNEWKAESKFGRVTCINPASYCWMFRSSR